MTNADPASMPEGQALLDAVGTAFARLRPRTRQAPVDPPASPKNLKRNLVLNLVDEARATGTEMTVGGLAAHLLVDPSVASRMVSDCISHGYLVRAASQQDGRRTVLHLTEEGAALLDRFRRQQRQAFEYITRDWPDAERLEFARLLLKYADSTARLPAPGAVDGPPLPPVT
ncbi:MarR family winged helix-turn-helix transcriptional regulator [Streptosporangium pseudovulgare]|uniref:MarR family transcriptional regulator n=1 Tax=Streptosporangium pseudovulgare TaxID=35765 RepID=A0ABQ2RCJ6_9ACTN|nr:MarR family winged helix-turn-helix transcriptional regulator [Streptosporangium pseudovulgare]GGQ22424.1 MarR family transcriptional regulator [Streptosporangium pseudovulgare]